MVKPTKRSCNSSPARNTQFSVFEFHLDDPSEKQSSEKLSKFKHVKASPMNKYDFLQAFNGGKEKVKNSSENEPLDVDNYFREKEDSIIKLDAAVSCSSDSEELRHSPADVNDSACSFPGDLSCAQRGRTLGGSVTNEEHLPSCRPQATFSNQPLCIDSDDEQVTKESPRRELICVDSDDENRISETGLVQEQPSCHDSIENSHPSESTVVVKPDCIIFGNMYSRVSTFSFFQGSIRLEGSIVNRASTYFDFTWPISDIENITCYWCKEFANVMVFLRLESWEEKVAEIDQILSEKTGAQQLSFIVNDPKWDERQEAIESLDSRYKTFLKIILDIDPEWSEYSSPGQKGMYLSEDCATNEVLEEFVYPKGDPDAVIIGKKDVELLQPATFVNDTIIDFYAKYIWQNINPKQQQRFHFFNSFFFRKLADLDKDLSTDCEGRAAFERVRKWTRKVNLFEKDFLFIPVNFSLHWSLIVVCHPGEAAHYRYEEEEKASRVPCILHMDSISGFHRGLENLFQSYLWEEWKERHTDVSKDIHANFWKLPFIRLKLPQQQNSFDCGIFLLYYAERFVQQAPLTFNPFNGSSDFLNKEWFQPAEASNRRGYIRNLIYQVCREYSKEHHSDGDTASSDSIVENNFGKGYLLETWDGREEYHTDYCTQNAQKKVATPGRDPLYLRGPNYIHADCSFSQSSKLLSPIEEEKASAEKTASSLIAVNQHAAASVSGVPMILDDEDEGLEEDFNKSQTLPVSQNKEKFVPEVVDLTFQEFEFCVVEDSQEESPKTMVIDDDVIDTNHSNFRNDCPWGAGDRLGNTKTVKASEKEKNLGVGSRGFLFRKIPPNRFY